MKQKETEWTRLDNASKIFPATCNERDPKVIRFACELYEAVEPNILQRALDITIENFPLYKSVLRKGAFWYYLDSSDIKPLIQIESKPVCAPIYVGNKYNLLFRVFYYRNRINFEVFHALADGTGALWFMQFMVNQYLILRYKEAYADTSSDSTSFSGQMDDSFGKHFIGDNLLNGNIFNNMIARKISAYQIGGTRLEENRIKLIEGAMSVKAVLGQAHQYNTTLTIYIASLFIYSIYKEMPASKREHPVVLSVPINLRNYFESETARNFFSTMNVGYCFAKGTNDLQDVIKVISDNFRIGLTQESFNKQVNQLMFMEQNPVIRVIPLPLKDIFIRIGAKLSYRRITSTISNIGQISMPSEFNSNIRQFSVCTSARRPQITFCSYGDRMVVSFTSPFRDTDIQRTFFKLLSDQGIEIEITSNL